LYNTPGIGKDTEVVKGVKKSAHLMVDFLYTARTRLDIVADSQLFSNAIKFTEQGSIVVKVEKKEHDGKQYANVTVRDLGAGIDP